MIKCNSGKAQFNGNIRNIEADFSSIVTGLSQTLPRDTMLTLFLIGLFGEEIKETAQGGMEEHFAEYEKIRKFVETDESLLIKYIRNTADRGRDAGDK